MIREHEGIYYGFVDSSITEVYRCFSQFLQSRDILITCLDSTPQVAKLEKWRAHLIHAQINHQVIGDAVYISSQHVEALFKLGKTFYGFDELYLLRQRPALKDLPGRRYTSDGFNFSEQLPPDFVAAFIRLRAEGYLSDGCGLNFASQSLDLARHLEMRENQGRF